MNFAPAPSFDIRAKVVFELGARFAERYGNELEARSAAKPGGVQIAKNSIDGHDTLVQNLNVGRAKVFSQRRNQQVDQQAMVKHMKDCRFDARDGTATIPREQSIGGDFDSAAIRRNPS